MGRYLVGIDLGTTHTLLAYCERQGEQSVQLFPLPQLVGPGQVAEAPMLPSFRYHPAAGELPEGSTLLPWQGPADGQQTGVLGELARQLGTRVPGRLISSAKSWLSHSEVDRTAAILPWGAPDDVPRVSPVAASASYLTHLRRAWNLKHPRDPLEAQETVLTVPASFDEAARALTLEAAREAGLPGVRLLEEPQAACYDWVRAQGADLDAALAGVRLLLVVDVGGGTTDFTLIQVRESQDGPDLTRVGVGDHLMLGGDNMDLALAHLVEQRVAGGVRRLGAGALSQLVQQCRQAKELLLRPEAPESTTVTLLAAGSSLVGGSRSATLTRAEVQALVVDGFFPRCGAEERPGRNRSAVVEFGLPYAADAGITRHLAAFLSHHEEVSREALGEDHVGPPMPDALLLNGGVFNAAALGDRVAEVLTAWRGQPLKRLFNPDPDFNVARGATAYALALHGLGRRIGGGSARSYFLPLAELEGNQGVCLLPRGTEPGRELRLSQRAFSLRTGQPALFHLVSSTGDRRYPAGELVDLATEQCSVQPPLATVLEARGAHRGEVAVELAASLSEVGTLELECISRDPPEERWQLAFQLRGSAGPAGDAIAGHPRLADALTRLDDIYGARSRKVGPQQVKGLRADLEKLLGSQAGWDTALLRELFGGLLEGVRRRRRSADHERLWFSLAGFCLRPGMGAPLDDWRVEQLWKLYDEGVQYANQPRVWAEWWTLWRRVAGGLDESRQLRIYQQIRDDLRPIQSRGRGKARSPRQQSLDEMIRLAAGLEALPVQDKLELGGLLLKRLAGRGESPQTWWALGRLGARVPLYASAHKVVPPESASTWLQALLGQDWKKVQPAPFAAALVARLSGDRERDLPPELRQQVVDRLRQARAPGRWLHLVSEQVEELDATDTGRMFGESLPAGLRLLV